MGNTWGVRLQRAETMRLLIVSCLLAISFAVKLKPFVPQELDRAHLDIARAQFQKQKELGTTGEKVKTSDINLEEAEWKVLREATTQKTPEERSDTVPIVVGSVMAGLIVVVLVGYFVVRARKANNEKKDTQKFEKKKKKKKKKS